MSDTKWLVRRRLTWFCVLAVPRHLRPVLKAHKLVKTLATRDLETAKARRHAVLALFKRQIAEAEAGSSNPRVSAALEWREMLARLERGDVTGFWTDLPKPPDVEEKDHAVAVMHAALDQAADEIQHGGSYLLPGGATEPRPADPEGAKLFRQVATGQATPIKPLLDVWLGEVDIEQRSIADHRRAFKELLDWTSNPTIEGFDRRTAGRYVSTLLQRIPERKTIAKRLWSLSTFWRWLMAKGHTETNPWRDHGINKTGKSERNKEPERAFTDDELIRLFAGTQDRMILDLMSLGFHSGARLEELALLRVSDLDREKMTLSVIADPKTPSARRIVPVHSAVQSIVLARAEGKPADAFLLHELGNEPAPDRERSMAISKKFNRYRAKIGVDEKRDGRRRSLVNFHSFRRTFVTKAEQAGIPETTIRSVVGHKRAGVTFGTYSSGPSLEQRRACVEAVKLPL